MFHFEDFPENSVHEYGAFEVTAEEIVSFAREFDPQPFHLDEAAAKASLLGGLATSGWQTAAISMRLHCLHLLKDAASLGSPGIAEMKWLKPVLKGYKVRLRTKISSARRSQSRSGLGVLGLETTMLNQSGEELMWNRGTVFMACRDAPPDLTLYDPSAIARAPQWTSPPDLLSRPADAADDDGVLSGWFDDLKIGRTLDLGVHTFEPDNIIRFARKWDPQLFHIDPEAAANGPFGGLTASGWHTGAAGMRRHILTRDKYQAEAARRGLPASPRGPSPGFRDMKWLEPVFAGDTLHYYSTPVEKRKTSRPGWGIQFTRFEGVNQHGRKAYEYLSAALWPLKPGR
ncbi:MAG: MaoC/PaaZ C-terminal domain-containing protein [Beijerinckiaceae bacterium]